VDDAAKRGMDLVLGAIAAVLLSPLLLAAAVGVRLALGRPVLFKQIRPGRHGRPFTLYKLRTMADGPGSDAERLGRFGALLRSTSIDEIPELFNVLRGDMSLVGPRPLLLEYLDLYTPHQARRMEVRPGITGLAQVRGRNDLSFEERFELDVQYVDSRSLRLDLRILGETVGNVLRRRGIAREGHATVEVWTGPPQ
jgi:lipopolysaccharide/colanic/teichoic acid biosynthesis glycosyltransferase